MSYEIEVKYLVKNMPNIAPDIKRVKIVQGYLHYTKEFTVRIRIVDNTEAFITIKGEKTGITNLEFEFKIPLKDALYSMVSCGTNVLTKTRYFLPNKNHTIELDVFEGKHEGLILAEIELSSEDEEYHIPEWFGENVSTMKQFTNGYLATQG